MNHIPDDPFADETSSPTETLPDYVSHVSSVPVSLSRAPTYTLPRPKQPIIYSFLHFNEDTVFLMPPRMPQVPSPTPLYHIQTRIKVDPFLPFMYHTVVRRGGDEDGELVGEFEVSPTHRRAIVTFGEYATRLSSIMTTFDKAKPTYRWKHRSVDIRWDCSTKLQDGSRMCICTSSSQLQIANFVPPPIDGSPPLPDATLTVFPDGHDIMDEIILSSLIIARMIAL
ncbi:hypothetical protein K474DRAFT_884762 [Panus rudis PR-1116 ss-1]|nr:hypothetical protein K474DRAFT_884762 [Panus rudis PR-1116 ss-1]